MMAPPRVITVTGQHGLREAVDARPDWVWCLAPGAVPDGDALERLLDAADPAGEPSAALVAGLVLDGTGATLRDHVPAPRYGDEPAVIRLVGRRLLPIRHVSLAHCLVRRACFDDHGLPDRDRLGSYAATAWTAAVLASGAGYLAPESVVRLADAGPRRSRRSILAAAPAMVRMSRSGAWTRGELVGELARFGARLVDPSPR